MISWANVVACNKLAAKGMNLEYITPIIQEGKKVVQLEKEDIDEGTVNWKQSIILYVIGYSPTMGVVERFRNSLQSLKFSTIMRTICDQIQ